LKSAAKDGRGRRPEILEHVLIRTHPEAAFNDRQPQKPLLPEYTTPNEAGVSQKVRPRMAAVDHPKFSNPPPFVHPEAAFKDERKEKGRTHE